MPVKPDLLLKTRLFLLVVIALLLPFSKKAVPPVIILYTLVWLLDIKREGFSIKTLNNIFFILPVVFYLLHVLCLVNTDNQGSGLFDLEVKLSVLVFPALFYLTPEFIKSVGKKILLCFVFGNILSGLICLFYGYYRMSTIGWTGFLFYGDFSYFLHTSYSSMYYLFSLGILLSMMLEYNFYSYKTWFWLTAGGILFFIFLIYLNCSRAGIISLFGMTIYVLFYLVVKLKRRYFLWSFILIAGLISGLLFLRNPRIQEVKEFVVMPKDSLNPATLNGSVIRYLMAVETVHLIKDNFLFGVGTGDVKDELVKKYSERNIVIARDKRLNAHNQYLESFIGLGLPGFILLLALTFLPLYDSVKNGNLLIGIFSVIIITNFMFESMLDTQAGVVFFALFYSLLMVNRNNKVGEQIPPRKADPPMAENLKS